MNNNTRGVMVIVGVGLWLLLSHQMGYADSVSFDNKLSSQWFQWALSIPTDENPLLELDTTTEKCMVGQRGDVWFLAGVFGAGSATRKCAVPEGTGLFFRSPTSCFLTRRMCARAQRVFLSRSCVLLLPPSLMG